jgi:hypothetical protein
MDDAPPTDDGRNPYPWTDGWEPLLSAEQVRQARCSDCGGPARYVRFHGREGRTSPPAAGQARALLMCDSGHLEDCTGTPVFGGYGDIELAELADRVEGPDWAQHLALNKDWWRDGGKLALRAALKMGGSR